MQKNYFFIYLSFALFTFNSIAMHEHIQAQDVERFNVLCHQLNINQDQFTMSLNPTVEAEDLWLDMARLLCAGDETGQCQGYLLYKMISTNPTFTAHARGYSCYYLAKIYSSYGWNEKSENEIRKTFDFASRSPELALWLAEKMNQTFNEQERCQLYEMALSIQNPTLKARALIALGDLRHKDLAHPSYVDWYIDALEHLEDLNEYLLIARALIGLGDRGYKDEFHPKNEDFYLRALKFLEGRTNGHVLRARAYLGLGSIGYKDIEHPRPYKFYIHALEELNQDHNPDIKAEIYIKIAELQFRTYRDEAEAIHYYKDALALKPSKWIEQKAQYGLRYVLDTIQQSEYNPALSN